MNTNVPSSDCINTPIWCVELLLHICQFTITQATATVKMS